MQGLSRRDRVSDESRIIERTPRTVRLQDAWCGVFLRFQVDGYKQELVKINKNIIDHEWRVRHEKSFFPYFAVILDCDLHSVRKYR